MVSLLICLSCALLQSSHTRNLAPPPTVVMHCHPAASRLVLGIESSCDDTGIAIVSSTGHVLGESIASQADIHAPWGGVVPKLAQDAHQAAINSCVDKALQEAGITPGDLDAIAVTVGPGLSLCLRVSNCEPPLRTPFPAPPRPPKLPP